MDGLANLLGCRTILLETVSGSLRLSPPTLFDLAEREALIVQLKTDPRELLAAIPARWSNTDRQFAADKASALADVFRKATADDLAAFDASLKGMLWRLARALRKHHPEQASESVALETIRASGKTLAEWQRTLLLVEERDLIAKVYFPGAGSGGNGDRFPWATLFRNLTEQHGWTWDAIGNLTLYAALVASGGKCPEDGSIQLDQGLGDFQAWNARRKLIQAFL